MSQLSILFASAEMAPWVKTWGLCDVAAAWPAELQRAKHDSRVLIPAFPAMRQAFPQATLPVSYTHLDVYKRQAPGSGHPDLLPHRPDVYKRQRLYGAV